MLGLTPDASEGDIRKKYRQLAMKYHPDRNPGVDAQEKFILLTEAYEVLMGKKSVPNAVKAQVRRKTKEDDHVERMKTARRRFTDQVQRERLENERYFNFLTKGRKWKTIRAGAFIGTLLFTLFILDLFLPHHFEEDKVTHFNRSVGSSPGGTSVGLIKSERDDYYWVSHLDYSLYGHSHQFYVESSWIFHNPIRLIVKGKLHNEAYDIHFTVYNSLWFVLIIFLLPLITMQYKRKSIRFTLLYHASYFGTSSTILLFLLTGERWAHLLSLGFI